MGKVFGWLWNSDNFRVRKSYYTAQRWSAAGKTERLSVAKSACHKSVGELEKEDICRSVSSAIETVSSESLRPSDTAKTDRDSATEPVCVLTWLWIYGIDMCQSAVSVAKVDAIGFQFLWDSAKCDVYKFRIQKRPFHFLFSKKRFQANFQVSHDLRSFNWFQL
jgi:hypothetical protein